ncbi:MAG: cytochrome c biogenesis CcdA family protein [Candidatus Thorarchaeota archaeon]
MQGFIEIGVLLAKFAGVFGAGLYVAMSPCLFPLLPLFLLNSLKTADSRKRSVVVTAILVVGILSSLALFLSIAWIIGGLLIDYYIRIQAVFGLILIILGVVTMSTTLKNKLGISSLNLRSQPTAPSNLFSVYLVGLGYSLLAAPCSGPAIFGVIAIFGAESGFLIPVLLFLVLSIAIAIPYFAIAIVTGEARLRMARSISTHARKVEIITGMILVVIGVILFSQLFGFRLTF